LQNQDPDDMGPIERFEQFATKVWWQSGMLFFVILWLSVESCTLVS